MGLDDATDDPRLASGLVRVIAAITSSTSAAATKATSLPSFAMCIGSSPRNEHAAATSAGTGSAASSYSTPTPADAAISHSDAASPPRVGSRSTWRSGQAATIAATSSWSGAESLQISVPNSRPSRWDMTATPCRPMGPETMTTSPGVARDGRMSTPAGMMPAPAVLT
ncbi:MAG: hypothetical protein R2715_00210 [Ilumatobacteraceae bacterium]